MRAGSGGGGGLGRSLPTLAALNASPAMAWMAGGVPDPLDPLSRKKKVNDLANFATAGSRMEHYAWGSATREQRMNKALARANKVGGIGTQAGLANAADGLGDFGVQPGEMLPVFMALNAKPEMVDAELRAGAVMRNSRSDHPTGWLPLRNTLAMSRAVENHPALGGDAAVGQVVHDAMVEKLAVTSNNFARHTSKNRSDLFPMSQHDHDFIDMITKPDPKTGATALWDNELELRRIATPDMWNSVSREARWTISDMAAQEHLSLVDAYRQEKNDTNLNALRRSSSRLANIAHLNPETGMMGGPFAQ